MVDAMADDDFEIAYIKQQRAILDSRAELAKLEYEHLRSKKQAGNNAVSDSTSQPRARMAPAAVAHKPGEVIDLTTPEPEDTALRGSLFPIAVKEEHLEAQKPSHSSRATSQVDGGHRRSNSPTKNQEEGNDLELEDGQSDEQSFDDNFIEDDGHDQQSAQDDGEYHPEDVLHSSKLAVGSKRALSDRDSDSDSDCPDARRSRPRTIRQQGYRTAVHKGFPTIARTLDGDMAEYRCNHPGCFANGTFRAQRFALFTGITGLQSHIRNMASHSLLSHDEVRLSCIYHTLDEREAAAVSRGDLEGYKIEPVFSPSPKNIYENRNKTEGRVWRAGRREERFRRSVSPDHSMATTTKHKRAKKSRSETQKPIEADGVGDETATYQAVRQEYFGKKMEGTATAEEDADFSLLDQEEKARMAKLQKTKALPGQKSFVNKDDDETSPKRELVMR